MRDYNKKNLTFEERNTRDTNPSREKILIMAQISILATREGQPITIEGDSKKGVKCSPSPETGKCPHMIGQKHGDIYVPGCTKAGSSFCRVESQLRVCGVSERVLPA